MLDGNFVSTSRPTLRPKMIASIVIKASSINIAGDK
ncbi:Uncharacterised protein [Mycobacterium tuberculosis]|uniref:Uncharacterized protein n=1 Tax=Mycobacterium tuberculosis TaxID=1773 RepID=A0A655JLA7_MYCTX|nr:Uncharacterised protein [Mycobacterium tuberculosis]COX13978.1 Uncharacterised protein [Mycobacterium tuberculosis]CPA10271.1 Uncharacterised protein [Mycobacterium tuberculosis]CPA95905.1 Uncharacterised protein [Mycobacterium tuberculosis]CPC07187.1 Uncharacterised protein [Mycobacterium tuberculosis]